MLERLGHFLSAYCYAVLLAWLVLAAGLKAVAPAWESVATDGDFEQLPANTTTARAADLISRAFPDDRAKSDVVLVFARDDQPLTVDDRASILELAESLRKDEALPLSRGDDPFSVLTEKTPVIGPMLKNASGSAQRVVVRLSNDFMATDNIRVLELMEARVAEYRQHAPDGLQIGITGSAAVGGDMLSAAAESVKNTHRTTLLMVVTALIFIYRSPRLVVIPLVAIAIAASVSIDLLAILAAWSQAHPDVWPTIRIFTTTKIFVIVLLFGAGTDYCLFLIARFREEFSRDKPSETDATGTATNQISAVGEAVGRVGIALTASALTTVVGLAMMGFAEFGKFAYSGPAIAVSLVVTLVVCLTLVPALLATPLGAIKLTERETATSPFWNRLADFVLARPAALLAGSLLVALPLAWQGAKTPVTYDLFSELPRQRVSRQGTRLLQRHFPPGELGPLTVLAHLPGGDFESNEGRVKIARLAKPLDDLPAVVKVRSLDQPTGDPPGTVRLGSFEGMAALAAKASPQTKAAFVSEAGEYAGEVTRLSLILDSSPFSAAAVETCERIERRLAALRQDKDSPWYNATFELTGPTAQIRDLEEVTLRDRWTIEVLVAGAVLLVLLILLKHPVTACYLIATVVLSYLVTLGLVGLAFHGIHLLSGVEEAWLGVDWKVPVFLFVILTAVGQDYNIYLVTRVFEEQERHGALPGLRRALVQTGGIITSCGVVMAGTFVSMMTGSLRGMVELGAALSLGILLDTFVVRTILVPAFLALLAKWGKHPQDASR